jgi:phage-related protein
MPATAAQIIAKIDADLTGFKKGMQESRDDTEKQKSFFKSAFGDMIGVAGGMLAAAGIQFGIQQIVQTFTGWVEAAIQAQQNQAQLNNVLRSTHDAVGMSADQINAMVQSLKNLTGVDDDVILQGTNMLLTFTNIGKTVFPEANQAMEDMAVAMNHGSLQGLDMKDTAIQLGKALNDPINGISALARVGVTFTQQQKDQIKAMVEAGDTAGAQKVILQELEKEFGGAAKAAGDADPFNKFKLAVGDIGKTIGGIVLPPLTAFMDFITPLVQQFQENLVPAFQQAGKYLGDFGGQVQQVLGFLSSNKGLNLGSLFGDVGSLGKGFDFSAIVKQFQDLGNVIATQVLPIALQLAGWFKKDMIPAIQEFMPHLQSFAQFIVTQVVPAFVKIETYGMQVGAVIAKTLLPIFEKIEPIIVRIAGWLLDMGQKALAFLIPKVEQAVQAISKFATEMSTRLGPFINQMVGFIQMAATVIGNVWGFLWPWVSGILQTAWDIIEGIVKTLWDTITGIFKIGADILSGNWGQLWADVKGLFDGIHNDLMGIANNLWNDLKHLWDVGTGYVKDVWSKVWSGLSGIASDAWNGVKGTIRNGINGVIDLINDMIRLADKVPGVNIPQIGHVNFAFGGTMPYSGMAMVGEAGPEPVFLPEGAQTVSHTDALRALRQGAATGGNGGMHVHIHGVIDAGMISQVVGLELKKVMLQHGF